MARNREKEKQDKKGERIAHQFLLEHFYTQTDLYHECVTKEEQLKGYDTTFTFNGLDYKCDEKAALDYVNKDWKLNTFCLELSCLDRNDNMFDGWFINPNEENNSYLFVWIDKADNDIINDPNEIQECEYMLVTKDDIKEYLSNLGWNDTKLKKKAEKIRYEDDTRFGDYKINGCKFSYPKHLVEKPINILLTRYAYRNMPHTHCWKYRRV